MPLTEFVAATCSWIICFKLQNIVLVGNLLDAYHFLVDTGIDIAVFIQYIGNTTAHTCSKVLAGLYQGLPHGRRSCIHIHDRRQPSTTAVAPEFLTQKRSPATPLIKALPLVAPYRATLPMIIFSSCFIGNACRRIYDQACHRKVLCQSNHWHHPPAQSSCLSE